MLDGFSLIASELWVFEWKLINSHARKEAWIRPTFGWEGTHIHLLTCFHFYAEIFRVCFVSVHCHFNLVKLSWIFSNTINRTMNDGKSVWVKSGMEKSNVERLMSILIWVLRSNVWLRWWSLRKRQQFNRKKWIM